ncbi:Glyoxylate/succinic semialdehyde reductase 2, chloroplastic [Planktothrix tepida]|uniref:3-hydroxyacid dehydrogenase n=1 Tax=Planktothrix tepida PCC 9214 TaxID=671072 RepID=A0A1J1LL86_9CYAN|nr:NAD(P)-dependent oxidoreductase [Planktothrix tepida]CAD5937605.1 Glyoxylate/succinic semialdehyde reductase 2, chloroplastic [Planktothrix tepida]CUR33325.1 3-hydroxyacid dehydrogenase [Planktothrix tepida PCC 9214]
MRIGIIGTGLMGFPMAQRLLEAGYQLIVYNRTTSKVEPLREAGATVAGTPQGLIATSDCILLMLTNQDAIESVLFRSEFQSFLSGKTVISMGTISPTDSKTIQKDILKAGGDYLEAPVLGSIPEAKAGTLQIMVGSTEAQFDQWLNLLKFLGEPKYIGEVGSAAALKLALNQLIASLTTAFALSLNFVQQQGVDIELFMEILRNSALYAPTFDKKLQRMLEENYENPNFPVKHLLKDTNLFLQEAVKMGLNASSLEGVKAILEATQKIGKSDDDYSALFTTIKP